MANKEWCLTSLAVKATFFPVSFPYPGHIEGLAAIACCSENVNEVFLQSVHMVSIGSFMSLHSKAPAFFFLEGEPTLASSAF